MNDESTSTKERSTHLQTLYPLGFRHDAQELSKMTVMFTLAYMLSIWSLSTVSLIFMSRLGETEFNASALAFTIYSLVSNTVMVGITYGSETLLPQCYGGNKRKMGIIVQRSIIIASYVSLIIWAILLNMKYILSLFMKNQHTITLTDNILRCYLFLVPLDALALLLRSYITSSGRIFPTVVIYLIGNIVNIISHYICLYHTDINIYSSPLSIILSYLTIVISIIIYIRISFFYEETWHPITHACLQEWNIYLKLALPGVMSSIITTWSFELGNVFAASLTPRSLSAQAIVVQVIFFVSLNMMAVGDSSTIFIGQNLGANKPKEAINAKNVTYTLAIILSAINMILLAIIYWWLPYIFEASADTISLARSILLWASLYSIMDGLNNVHLAIIKAW
ncbi:unnamed protein product [Adineta steineri]|uniref:MATE efflux family protein n=1 Tax=Adineta steineri TaxID=433720 RepID=A0A814BGR3_9BILA|nr:unnamed protein product [Adineta steineri]CAF3679373.1 unnamed protein product [Adineta steineri]